MDELALMGGEAVFDPPPRGADLRQHFVDVFLLDSGHVVCQRVMSSLIFVACLCYGPASVVTSVG